MGMLKLIPGDAKLTDGKVTQPTDAQKVYLNADHVDFIEPFGNGARLHTHTETFTPREFVVKATPAEVAAAVTKALQSAHAGEHKPCECPEPEPSNEPPLPD